MGLGRKDRIELMLAAVDAALDAARLRLEELNAFTEAPDFWNDPDAAQSVMRERNRLEGAITGIESIEQELNDQTDMISLAVAEDDCDVLAEADIDTAKIGEE